MARYRVVRRGLFSYEVQRQGSFGYAHVWVFLTLRGAKRYILRMQRVVPAEVVWESET